MATFITLIEYTGQGIKNIHESPKRADTFIDAAGKLGIEVKEIYWTLGERDGVLILDAPDDQAVAALLLSLGMAGNVRTHTLRDYDRAEMQAILAKRP